MATHVHKLTRVEHLVRLCTRVCRESPGKGGWAEILSALSRETRLLTKQSTKFHNMLAHENNHESAHMKTCMKDGFLNVHKSAHENTASQIRCPPGKLERTLISSAVFHRKPS